MTLRIVFLGSPEFAIPALEALHSHYGITGVITQPDRLAGRGKQLTPPPVKAAADRLKIPVIQPEKLSSPDVYNTIAAWQPELIVVAAYGQILRQNLLELPRYGCINIHPSLLPRWRGASPIPFTLLNGETEMGVTVMKMDAGMDTGDILSQVVTPILPEDNAGTLHDRLSQLGADLLIQTIPGYVSGQTVSVPQDDSFATYSRLITKQDGAMDFQKECRQLVNQVRAFTPWPGAFFTWKEAPFKVLKSHCKESEGVIPGEKWVITGLPAVGAKDGWLVIDECQPAGKKAMGGADFLRGVQDWI